MSREITQICGPDPESLDECRQALENEQFNREYELAIKNGDARFGSPCKHTRVKNGVCQNCLRRIM